MSVIKSFSSIIFTKFLATDKLLNSGKSNDLLAPSRYTCLSSEITFFICSIIGFITFTLYFISFIKYSSNGTSII